MDIIRKTIESDEKYLRQVSQKVDFSDKSYLKDIKLLEEFCLQNECFALAAIQIGIPKRIVYLKNTTLDVPLEEKNYNESKVLINPIVIERKGITKYWEACLSCLDYIGLVNRPYEMIVEYNDINGKLHKDKFEGFAATVLSHELDHLDGILHMDIAEKVIIMPREKRALFRECHPYEIISKNGEYHGESETTMNDLLLNYEKIHTTKLGVDRLKNNLKIDGDVVTYCKDKLLDNNTKISKKGKNWYCVLNNLEIVINASSYTIITAHIDES